MNTGEKLTELTQILGEIDQVNNQLKLLKEAKDELTDSLIEDAQKQGVDTFSNDLITVTVKEDMETWYDPEFWDDLVKWAGDTGNTQIIQRRLSKKPIVELIDNGHELPAGVRLEPKVKLSTRRK